jgi:hypothetical protein
MEKNNTPDSLRTLLPQSIILDTEWRVEEFSERQSIHRLAIDEHEYGSLR